MNQTDALKLRAEYAHHPRSRRSIIHELASPGGLIEYRRVFVPHCPCLFIEHRLLGPGGWTYPDSPDDGPWYLVTDEHLVQMNHQMPDILRDLHAMGPDVDAV